MGDKRSLDFRIYRRSRKVADLNAHADPDDHEALQKVLRNWLEGQKWDKGLWAGFRAEVRYAGDAKVRKTVMP